MLSKAFYLKYSCRPCSQVLFMPVGSQGNYFIRYSKAHSPQTCEDTWTAWSQPPLNAARPGLPDLLPSLPVPPTAWANRSCPLPAGCSGWCWPAPHSQPSSRVWLPPKARVWLSAPSLFAPGRSCPAEVLLQRWGAMESVSGQHLPIYSLSLWFVSPSFSIHSYFFAWLLFSDFQRNYYIMVQQWDNIRDCYFPKQCAVPFDHFSGFWPGMSGGWCRKAAWQEGWLLLWNRR